jgi:hypothetical protein
MAALSQLPAEILTLISSYLVAPELGFSDAGLLSLRLTCRALCLKTQYKFGRTAFSTLRLDLHSKTLQRLLDICRVPAHGEAVKKLVFAHWGDEYISFPAVGDEMRGEGNGEEKEGRGGELENQVLFVVKHIFEEAISATPNLKEIVLVTPLIARFRRHGYTLEAGLGDTRDRDLKVEEFCLPMSQLYDLLAQALATTKVNISSLETTKPLMPSRQRLWSVGCISTQSLKGTAHALRSMQHLTISLRASETSNDDGYLGAALRCMPLLTRLDIRFHSRASPWTGSHDPGLEPPSVAALRALPHVHFPRLTTFALGRAQIEERVLRNFLLAHTTTLERVGLCYVTLEQNVGWGSILASMLDNLKRLQELCVATSYNVRAGPGTFDLVGREAIVQHLGGKLGRV